MADSLLAGAPAPTTTTTSSAATVTTASAGASTQTPPQPPQPAAPEGDKTLLGSAPKPTPAEPSTAEKLYGKLVDKVVTDAEKKESAKEPAKAEEKKPEPPKPQEVKPGEKPAEIKYDLKAPEGSQLSSADVEKVTSLAKEANLSPEQAQKLLDAQSRSVTEYRDRLVSDFQKTSQQWVTDLQADKEFGGERFNETVELAKRAFNAYAGPELKKLLNDSGYGNHPELVKTFARIGKSLSDGRFISGGQPVVAKKGAADILYGNTTGKK